MAGFSSEALKTRDFTAGSREMDADQSHQPEELPALRDATPKRGHGGGCAVSAWRRDSTAGRAGGASGAARRTPSFAGRWASRCATSPTAIACTVVARYGSLIAAAARDWLHHAVRVGVHHPSGRPDHHRGSDGVHQSATGRVEHVGIGSGWRAEGPRPHAPCPHGGPADMPKALITGITGQDGCISPSSS